MDGHVWVKIEKNVKRKYSQSHLVLLSQRNYKKIFS